MRFRLLLVAAAIAAVLASVAAGAAPTRVSYLFKARFGLGYEVTWHTESGSRAANCGWSQVDGKNEINAASVDAPKTAYTVPGRWVLLFNGVAGRITGSAVGKAKVEMTRTRVETGGPSCDTPPVPFKPPPNDCGTKRYQTRAAALLGDTRKSTATLKDITQGGGSSQGSVVVSISIPAPPQPYRQCESSQYETGYAFNVALKPKKSDMAKLVNLQPGAVHRLQWQWKGDCSPEITAPSSCKAELDLHVDIRRWKPGEPYP